MTVGTPRFSSSGVTKLHHVEHEPQSPVAVMTTSKDKPTFTPGQTVAVRPAPVFVSYQ
jgi:hypothetical protein